MVVRRSLTRFRPKTLQRRQTAADAAAPPRGLALPTEILTCPPAVSPSLSLSLSPAQPEALLRFLRDHLRPDFSPPDLLRFLSRKLRYHPGFAAYDLFVFRWAAGVDSFRHDHSTFEWMARTLCVSDRLDDLRGVLGFMLSHPCPCAGDGIFACPLIEPIYSFALNALCRAGRADEAEAAFDDMRRSIDGKPTAAAYNILMSGFCKIERHEKVTELYRGMGKDGVKPDEVTFNIMINSLCKSGRFESVPDLFRDMKTKGCSPNVVSFNTLIVGFLRRRKIAQGIGVAREMLGLGYGISAATCEILIRGICREGKVSEACDLIMEFLRRGAAPVDLDCLNLVRGLCAAGEIDQAADLVDLLWKAGCRPGAVTCCALLEAMTNSGRIEDAVRLTEKIIEGAAAMPDVVTFNGLLRELCGGGRATEAERLRAAATSRGFLPDSSTFEIVAGGLAREGRKKEGEAVVEAMLDAGFIPNIHVYNRLMNRVTAQTGGQLRWPKGAH